nr:hypothetical protein [uncultured Draconibacterium sp.]
MWELAFHKETLFLLCYQMFIYQPLIDALKKDGYQLVRYADDFIVVFKSIDEAQKGYEIIFTYLNEKYSLNIHPLEAKNGKTEIINPLEREISFLSIKFDGTNICPSKESLSFLKSTIRI